MTCFEQAQRFIAVKGFVLSAKQIHNGSIDDFHSIEYHTQ